MDLLIKQGDFEANSIDCFLKSINKDNPKLSKLYQESNKDHANSSSSGIEGQKPQYTKQRYILSNEGKQQDEA